MTKQPKIVEVKHYKITSFATYRKYLAINNVVENVKANDENFENN